MSYILCLSPFSWVKLIDIAAGTLADKLKTREQGLTLKKESRNLSLRPGFHSSSKLLSLLKPLLYNFCYMQLTVNVELIKHSAMREELSSVSLCTNTSECLFLIAWLKSCQNVASPGSIQRSLMFIKHSGYQSLLVYKSEANKFVFKTNQYL